MEIFNEVAFFCPLQSAILAFVCCLVNQNAHCLIHFELPGKQTKSTFCTKIISPQVLFSIFDLWHLTSGDRSRWPHFRLFTFWPSLPFEWTTRLSSPQSEQGQCCVVCSRAPSPSAWADSQPDCPQGGSSLFSSLFFLGFEGPAGDRGVSSTVRGPLERGRRTPWGAVVAGVL